MRFSSLLLFIPQVLGCSSPDRGAPDMRAVPAARPAGEKGADAAENGGWPAADLAAFLFTHLDLTTFRNSTGPMRKVGDRYFSDLGVRPTETSGTMASYDGEGWHYRVRVLARRDFNGDGVDEVAICFSDQARNGGTYDTRSPLLLQLVDQRVIALSFEIDGMDEAETCPVKPEREGATAPGP